LNVKDLDQSRKFFTEVLGFPQVGENDRGMLFFCTDMTDNHHMLAVREAKPGAP
jgi:catechol 2,3-dioxygenase-like lactoylglutathione lyase family enzyme